MCWLYLICTVKDALCQCFSTFLGSRHPLELINIWQHLNAPKMTISDTLNSKVLMKRQLLYRVICYINFWLTPGTSSLHPGVNFINILCVHFAPISLSKNYKAVFWVWNCLAPKYRQKSVRKMLVKLTLAKEKLL